MKKIKENETQILIVFGEEHCKIVNTNDTKQFNQIKEEIHIYEFQTVEEMEADEQTESFVHLIYICSGDSDEHLIRHFLNPQTVGENADV
ncbi:MAG: hypothetical protein CO128_01330 [Ignavibacteriales bacterium CG_4_9_14_3_um_filter_30_11]|nr:MAG: hypothetical protein CO128_01330 [Ignavibacteriales bacterium CG_4_9_14_3_um_filter_30_11]